MKKSEIKTINIIAILAIFVFSGAGSLMNAAVQTMIDAWPNVNPSTIRLVTSLPSLISLPVTIIVGFVAGKKLSYRFCAIFGTLLIMLGGAAPALFHTSWSLVLVFRALVGVGVGFIAMRNSLIIDSVPEDKQASVIGYGAGLLNGGAILAGPLVGVLSVYGWNYAFLYDLLAIVPILLMVLFLKEPEKTEDIRTPEMKYENTAEKTDWRIYFYVFIQFIMTAALYPLLSGMSTYMAYKGVGDAVTAGFSNSTYNLVGFLICLVIGPIEKKLGRHMLWTMSLIFAGGMALIVWIPKVPVILIGAGLCGIAFNSVLALLQLYNGKVASARQATLISTVLIAAMSLGNFASVYFINICQAIFRTGNDIESTYIGSMLLYLILAVVSFVMKPAPKEYYEK